ncbi:MerR family transcriptional regulator [Paenibacillus sp. SI8]|uniref:MerR family transcriptional regulator n=1 Tax=unclassified Paenibacillus TaxID=185978 RepID=UPI0034677519
MFIREVEKQTGMSAHTIRYYEKMGLLPGIARSSTGVRSFTEADVNLLAFIGSLKKTGMSLEHMTVFLQEGCLIERVKKGNASPQLVEDRLKLLRTHKLHLLEQMRDLESLIEAVNVKTDYYENLLRDGCIFSADA